MSNTSLRDRVFHVYRDAFNVTKPGDTIESWSTGPIKGKILGIRAPWKLVFLLASGEWPKSSGRGSSNA